MTYQPKHAAPDPDLDDERFVQLLAVVLAVVAVVAVAWWVVLP